MKAFQVLNIQECFSRKLTFQEKKIKNFSDFKDITITSCDEFGGPSPINLYINNEKKGKSCSRENYLS